MSGTSASGADQPGGRGPSDELARLLDGAVARLARTRRTFTEEEALREVWAAGYEVTPESDGRFALAAEGDGTHLREWRLATQALANDRLLDALLAGTWDGRDLDAELERLDAAGGEHRVFCPRDRRFAVAADGALEPAEGEAEVPLPSEERAALDALAPALLARWREAGPAPWTPIRVCEAIGALGWVAAGTPGAWLRVRSWLGEWPEAARVGRDLWVLTEQLPAPPTPRRLQVLPQRSDGDRQGDGAAPGSEHGRDDAPETDADGAITPTGDLVPIGTAAAHARAAWMATLRTSNLVDGYLRVPQAARGVYPPQSAGSQRWALLRGKWFDTGEDLWLWLDRDTDLLCGPDLADRLAWCDAGTRLRVEWGPGVVVLRTAGVDAEAEREETRLVDVEALAQLRGGLGESYRTSLQAILAEAPEGLSFAQVVEAIRERQGHAAHRGTVRAALYAGGFVLRDGRWHAAADADADAGRLRRALGETPLRAQDAQVPTPKAMASGGLQALARALGRRLREIRRAIEQAGRPRG